MDKETRNKRNQEVLKLYNLGSSYREIAKKVGLSKTGVYKIIHSIPNNVILDNSMTLEEKEFEIEVNATLEKIKLLLIEKGREYRRNEDVYHNFNEGSKITGEIPEKVLYGFMLKHLVSANDIRNDISIGKLPSKKIVEEKWTDILVYTIIEKCMILKRISNNQ